MTTKPKKFKRVTWRVVRCDIGWKPVVLIGEAPMSLPAVATKKQARKLARSHAAQIDYTSRQH